MRERSRFDYGRNDWRDERDYDDFRSSDLSRDYRRRDPGSHFRVGDYGRSGESGYDYSGRSHGRGGSPRYRDDYRSEYRGQDRDYGADYGGRQGGFRRDSGIGFGGEDSGNYRGGYGTTTSAEYDRYGRGPRDGEWRDRDYGDHGLAGRLRDVGHRIRRGVSRVADNVREWRDRDDVADDRDYEQEARYRDRSSWQGDDYYSRNRDYYNRDYWGGGVEYPGEWERNRGGRGRGNW